MPLDEENTHLPARPPEAGAQRRVGRRWRRAGALVLLLGVAVNVVTFQHAWRSTHFVERKVRAVAAGGPSLAGKLWFLFAGLPVERPHNGTDPASLGFGIETLRFTTSDGLELEAWYAPAVDARGLSVLFHGYSAAKESLLEAARAYHDFGYDVLLVDFRGSGGSDGNVTSIGWYEALDVQAAVRFARERYAPRRLLLHGVSLGAAAILRAIGTRDVVADALVLEAPFHSLLATTARRFQKRGLPSFPFARLLVFWGGLQLGFDGFAHNPQDYMARVDCPALLLFGAEDPNIPRAHAHELLSRAGPSVEHRFLDGAGHPPLIRRHGEAWIREVGAFLEALP